MFVFKAGVVGDEEIAAAIEAAGIPVAVDMDAFGDVDFVIAAEGADFAVLDACTPGHAVLASSSTQLSITELGELTLRPDKVIGFHFAGARLVEVVESDDTSPETVQAAMTFAQALRRTPIRCGECPGFVVERLLGAVNGSPELAEAYGERFDAAGDPFVEACLILEEGISSMREIDLAAALGAGIKPGPFAQADAQGLDAVLAALEEPPLILRRLFAQGRLGRASGQGFYPYPAVEDGYADAPVKLDVRGDVAVVWLDNPPANSLSPAVIEGLRRAWDDVVARGCRAMVLASANPALFCAGADIKAFTTWNAASGRAHLERIHALVREWEHSGVVTIAAVNGAALGGGCEVAMACDVRLAALSASFGQPEINLGIIPGFGGTQRLPRLVGPAKALEMNTLGDPISAEEAFEYGLVNRVVLDQELFDAALAWGRRVAGQAPVALEQIKRVSAHPDLDTGLAAERDGFMTAFGSDDAREGIAAFIEKRRPEFRGS
jgi:enoyl-CoA hydratase/3-hydroxyacyl-CoA dehydrogenase